VAQLRIEPVTADSAGRRFRAYTAKHLDGLVQRAGLSPSERLAVRAVGMVLPFRTNDYVVDNLIDWHAAPDDPIYRLVFPQPDMLPADDIDRLSCLLARSAPEPELRAAVRDIRMRLNPHPAGQPAMRTAPTASGGRSSWTSPTSRWPPPASTGSWATSPGSRMSPAC
jgi:hypothetical protein